jgi:hypothetical protein
MKFFFFELFVFYCRILALNAFFSCSTKYSDLSNSYTDIFCSFDPKIINLRKKSYEYMFIFAVQVLDI